MNSWQHLNTFKGIVNVLYVEKNYPNVAYDDHYWIVNSKAPLILHLRGFFLQYKKKGDQLCDNGEDDSNK